MTYILPNARPPRLRYCIGIDPDLKLSGFANYDRQERKFIHFQALKPLALLKTCAQFTKADCEIYVEAGWQNDGQNDYQYDTRPPGFDKWSIARQRGYMFSRGVDVGTNFGAGIWTIDILRDVGYTVHEYRPRTAKWDAKHLKFYTGITNRTNQDVRDAIRAAFLNK